MRSAAEWIDSTVDAESWESWDEAEPESVLTGRAAIGGHAVALVVSEFGFAGGSIGRATGERIAGAVDRARAERLPVLAMPASGGTRMKEGTPAFLEMAVITAAVLAHRDAGLPYLVYLRHPTTGGVFASWGSLGQVTWAQPGALIGFLGPKVYEGLYGEPFPDGVQRAENLHEHGVVDDVVEPEELAGRVRDVLDVLAPRPEADCRDTDCRDTDSRDADEPAIAPCGSSATAVPADAWAAVQATRASDRAGLVELLDDLRAVPLARNGAVRVAVLRARGVAALLIGQDRTAQADGVLIGASALRTARHAVALAATWSLPLVTVIDTPGGELSPAAEERGLASEIAHCLAAMIATPSPTLSILAGQGGGGAALALFPADRTVAAPDAWLSPLPPEGASIIVHGDLDHAAELARAQRIWSRDLKASGLVDAVTDDLVAAVAEWLATGPVPHPDRRTRRAVGG